MADANYWFVRNFARKTQSVEEMLDVLAVDQLPPIHAGSRASPQFSEEFRALMEQNHGKDTTDQDDVANSVASPTIDANASKGTVVIQRFSNRPGQVVIGLPQN